MFPYRSNLPADVITNTFHMDWQGGVDAESIATQAAAALADFYDGAYANMGWANYVNQAAAEVRFYLMDLPAPRIPIVRPLGVTNTTDVNTTIPAEVAVVCSFHAALVSGQTQARRRGRVYLGGTGSPTINGTAGSLPAVAPAVISNITDAAEALRSDLDGMACPWVVYSPTAGSHAEVVGGWVDNEPDTQRRRGVEATSRSVWP